MEEKRAAPSLTPSRGRAVLACIDGRCATPQLCSICGCGPSTAACISKKNQNAHPSTAPAAHHSPMTCLLFKASTTHPLCTLPAPQQSHTFSFFCIVPSLRFDCGLFVLHH